MIRLKVVLILLSLLGKATLENVDVPVAESTVEEHSPSSLPDDSNGILPSETVTVEETVPHSSVAHVPNNATNNVTVNPPRPVCEVGKGCNPRLECLNFSSLNDSNLEGLVGQRRAVIVSVDQLEYILENPGGHVNGCILVMFYGDWCPYSVEFAPVYNELGTRFPDLLVLAMDFGAQEPDKFVLAYLPRVLIYYSGRAVFNIDTNIPLQELEDIVSNMTGMLPDHSEPNNESEDAHTHFKKLPTSRKEDRLFLIVCVLWLVVVFVVQLIRTEACASLLTSVWSRLHTTTIKED